MEKNEFRNTDSTATKFFFGKKCSKERTDYCSLVKNAYITNDTENNVKQDPPYRLIRDSDAVAVSEALKIEYFKRN